MTDEQTEPTITVCDRRVASVPDCCGVYRFFSDTEVLLYVGKSVSMESRIREHLRSGRIPSRKQRMMRHVARIDCTPTLGDMAALLTENHAIKMEVPLYNRRQRVRRTLLTIELQPDGEGFLQPLATDFIARGERSRDCFGLYHNKRHVESTLRRLARDHGLCLLVLGLDKSRAPCFQFQIGRCDGACVGEESPEAHNQRLLSFLESEQILAWPFSGPVVIVENGVDINGKPACSYCLIDHWLFRGCYATAAAARRAAESGLTDTAPEDRNTNTAAYFDRDAYRLILQAMNRADCRIEHVQDNTPVAYPFARAS